MTKKQESKRVGRPTLKPGMKAQRIAISLLPTLIEHAEKRAVAEGESLSAFIGSLIESDMAAPAAHPSSPLEARVERLESAVFGEKPAE